MTKHHTAIRKPKEKFADYKARRARQNHLKKLRLSFGPNFKLHMKRSKAYRDFLTDRALKYSQPVPEFTRNLIPFVQ